MNKQTALRIWLEIRRKSLIYRAASSGNRLPAGGIGAKSTFPCNGDRPGHERDVVWLPVPVGTVFGDPGDPCQPCT